MKLVTYQIDRFPVSLGVVNQNETFIYPLKSFEIDYKTMEELIAKISEGEMQRIAYGALQEPDSVPGAAPFSDVRLLAPIPHPGQDIICLGINYMAHAEESARYKKQTFNGERPYAVYFSKRANEAVNPGGNILSHEDIVDSLDYEAELAVIIGKEAKNVPEDQVRNYIFGYTILNDVSARNIQNRHKQWFFGKSLDGFLPMGPCIVTADGIPYPPALSIQSKVNGQLRQDSNTSLLIFGIDHVVSELSRGMTLKPGTILSMGTPAGVGMGFDPPRFLKPGDTVECIIEGIGTLSNQVV
ncbi:MAG: fumarylacetoacetate hydrolase family protein [Lachnospiraceae bacterium]|jgi:2-keto-4-pentenoate hydratase/2-oxohepta-3-ene-1,7-dioic acid hydratase in catechol pathway|nr:fumarylacetoacetate hydrolase family protein [Lachnospiraceae bacterium]